MAIPLYYNDYNHNHNYIYTWLWLYYPYAGRMPDECSTLQSNKLNYSLVPLHHQT